jgi:hypothetical protein
MARPDRPSNLKGHLNMRLSNPAQERARAALSLEQMTKADRATVAVHLRRFVVALKAQRRFDQAVADSITRLARDPAFKQQISQLLSPKGASL